MIRLLPAASAASASAPPPAMDTAVAKQMRSSAMITTSQSHMLAALTTKSTDHFKVFQTIFTTTCTTKHIAHTAPFDSRTTRTFLLDFFVFFFVVVFSAPSSFGVVDE